MGKEFQLSEEGQRLIYDINGIERPAEPRSTMEWYARQGYEIMHPKEQEYFAWDVEGKVVQVPIVWMRKDLA